MSHDERLRTRLLVSLAAPGLDFPSLCRLAAAFHAYSGLDFADELAQGFQTFGLGESANIMAPVHTGDQPFPPGVYRETSDEAQAVETGFTGSGSSGGKCFWQRNLDWTMQMILANPEREAGLYTLASTAAGKEPEKCTCESTCRVGYRNAQSSSQQFARKPHRLPKSIIGEKRRTGVPGTSKNGRS